MQSDIIQYGFYIALVAITGAGEYFKLLPSGTMIAVLALVTGHFFGSGTTKTALSSLSQSVASIAQNVNTSSAISTLQHAHQDDVRANGGVTQHDTTTSDTGPKV
jgi:hypothetical protein